MSGKVEARLKELGIVLPAATPPWANYVSFVSSGQLVYLSGQLPQPREENYKGKLGLDLGIEDGERAARICAINLLPHLREACAGDLDRVARCLEIGGFVNSAPDFTDHPLVLNGASELLVQVLGEMDATPDSPSALQHCPSTSPSRSKVCSRSDDLVDDALMPRRPGLTKPG